MAKGSPLETLQSDTQAFDLIILSNGPGELFNLGEAYARIGPIKSTSSKAILGLQLRVLTLAAMKEKLQGMTLAYKEFLNQKLLIFFTLWKNTEELAMA